MSDKYKRYHKIAKIGSGGMGDVFRVLDMDLGRECALKCVPLQVASESGVEGIKPSGRLLREVSIMTGIQDPNVVYIYDHFQHESQLCIVMELCQISVADWVQQRESFSLLTTLEMANQILSALILIHDNGIIHRDIKPQNFLLSTNSKQIYIIDFGISTPYLDHKKKHKPITYNDNIMGTIDFISYYLHEGLSASRRDDLISMIYVIIYMYNNILPWQINNVKSIYEMKYNIPPNILCKGLPEKINTILVYCYSLEYIDEPNYEYIRFLFETM